MDVNDQSGLNHSYFKLGAGVYDLQMTANGSEAASVAWLLRPLSLDYEKIAINGVGQVPALTLALVAPMTVTAEASGNSGWSGQPLTVATATRRGDGGHSRSTETTTAGAAPTGAGASAGGSATAVVPAALLMTLETNLAGLPTSDGWHTSAVGPLADGATVALADAGRGLPPGMLYRPSSGTDPRVGEGDVATGPEATSTGPLSVVGPAPSPGAFVPAVASARADAMALAIAQADPLVRIAGWFAGRLPAPSASPREPETPATDLGTTLLAAAASGRLRRRRVGPRPSRATLAQADLGVPFALLVGTALTYRLSQPIRKWWRRHHTAHPSLPRPHGMARADMTVRRV